MRTNQVNKTITSLGLVFVGATSLIPISVAKAQTPAAISQGTSVTGDTKNGQQLYLKYSCYACHGYSGQNGPGTRLVPTRMTVPGFTAYVRNPRQMPPYTAKVVPDAELADIWAYLQTLPRSPSPKDIPLLTRILNEK
jgi:mono/diheme cytochrome c family protein